MGLSTSAMAGGVTQRTDAWGKPRGKPGTDAGEIGEHRLAAAGQSLHRHQREPLEKRGEHKGARSSILLGEMLWIQAPKKLHRGRKARCLGAYGVALSLSAAPAPGQPQLGGR